MIAKRLDIEPEGPWLGNPVLVTGRLILRQPHPDDAADLARLANDRRIAAMLVRMPHPYGEAQAAAFIEACATRNLEHQPGLVRAVTLAESGAFVGCAGLEPKGGGFELGYWIGQPFWGLGFATEAAQALVDLAFRASDVDVLHASCRVTNPVSRRVIHKCGFQYAGQSMLDSIVAGRVPGEDYRLDRRTWLGLRSWSPAPH